MNWVGILLLVIYILSCIGLILIVLLQAGKGATLGASFGGGASQTVFGTQSATLISRLTWVLAAIFMACALILTKISPWGETKTTGPRTNVLHEEPVTQPQGAEKALPAVPSSGSAAAQGVTPTTGAATRPQAQSETQPAPAAKGQPQPESKPQHPQPETQQKP
jgi:preprotein translocase subunit SecG